MSEDSPAPAPAPRPGPAPLTYLEPQRGWCPKPLVAAHVVLSPETGEYQAGCTLTEDGTLTYHDSIPALLSHFLEIGRGGELLLHGADQVLLQMIPQFEQLAETGYDIEVTLNGREYITYATIIPRAGRGRYRIRDTSAVMPVPLDKLPAMSGVPLPDPDDLAGYARMILEAFRTYQRILGSAFQIGPGYTAGGTAKKHLQRTLHPDAKIWRQRRAVEKFAREGYYGGLTFWKETKLYRDVVKLDVNGMYAACMRDSMVPVGLAAWTDQYEPDEPGIYACRVTCPQDNPFPFVPLREDGYTTWPVRGTFDTVIPSNTIEAARRHGYEIEIDCGYVWETLAPLLTPFVDQCEQMELSTVNPALQKIIKQNRNSLVGKFGQAPIQRQYVITAHPDIDMTPVISLDGQDVQHLWYREGTLDQPHIQPHWAAWITAAARNVLAEAAYSLGPENCLYGDTDSIVVPYEVFKRSTLAIGRQYGEWKIQGEYKSFQVVHGKTYLSQDHTGEWEIKHNGIPAGKVTVAEMQRVADGEAIEIVFPTLPRALSVLGGKPIALRTIARTLRSVYNTDRWERDPAGVQAGERPP